MNNEKKSGKLLELPTEKVYPNPYNPRMLFDKIPIKTLQESIKEVGILVPLLIYERKKDGKYIILDGQRRWICAKNLELKVVPANLIDEPKLITNILTMFNIHNIREPWELMPTALKLEVVMRELKTESESKLAKLTGLTPTNVRRCKILLSYDKKYQDLMLTPNPAERVKADFFIEMYTVLNLIERYLPKISKEYPRKKLIDIFLDKYLKNEFTNVLHFRRIAVIIRSINKGASEQYVEELIFNFIREKQFNISSFEEPIIALNDMIFFEKSFSNLSKKLISLDVKLAGYDEKFYNSLIEFKVIIENKIKEVEKLKRG